MRVFRVISEKASEARLPFLIIGGYAVMAHGFVRSTDDLDLLVRRSQRPDWRRLLESLGRRVFREAPTFLQFNPPPGGRLPVDLMFVADEVFERMQASAGPTKFGDVSIGVVSLLQRIALKCHALQHGKALRRLKDTDDLIHLIKINALDLQEPGFGPPFSSMPTRNSTKSSSEPAPPTDGSLHDAPGLEFPDWSGMVSHPNRMSLAEAIEWNEEMLELFPPKPNRAVLDAEAKCQVEFLL